MMQPTDGSSVQIGALVPLSRPGWIEAGHHLLAGLELAVRDVNGSGGIVGRRLEMVVRDTAADPQRVNGQPLVASRDPGAIANVLGLDVHDGRIARLHSILNPDKLPPPRSGL